MRTRRASIADLDVLVPLFDGYRIFYGQVSDEPLARTFLGERLAREQSVVFLAEDEAGVALGFTQLFPSFSSARARPILILNDLFVTQAARCRGVARRLLETAVAFAKESGVARLTLSTAVDNHTAQSLYRAAGWKQDEAFLVYHLALD